MRASALLKALAVVLRTQPDTDINTSYEQICIADATLPMPEEDVAQLKTMGWYIDEDSWCHFV